MRSRRHEASTVALAVAAIWYGGCKPSEPPAPQAPSAPPLAKSDDELDKTGSAQLPPGHPPIAGQPQPPAGSSRGDNEAMGLPEGHPPIGPAAGANVGPGPGQDMALPPDHPQIAAPGSGGTASGPEIEAPTKFVGISLTPPEAWKPVNPTGGQLNAQFAPVAAFDLSRADGDFENASVRLTHFPSMSSVPLESNLERWYGQVIQPDGRATKDVAKRETLEVGGATITLVDMSGIMSGREHYRMIAAQIDHPKGPHFLKVAGPEATVAKWRDSVEQYLRSIKIEP